ncbi:hypothetical protein WN944_024511 [Citrus x changshan-huyou]|uniref:Arabinogalactan peptide 23-like n=1 Tax=Citrus x changshan-huyou TaxID=2935761 RepID=A0AAP0LN43_9ROSI
MDVRKISCAVLVAVAACLSVAVAADPVLAPAPATAQGPEAGGPGPSMAPSDSADGAAETLPVMGSLVVASLVSFLAYYWQ